MQTECFSDEKVNEAEQYMRHSVIDNANRQSMLHKLYITRTSRRKFIVEHNSKKSSSLTFILNNYPLLIRFNKGVSIENYSRSL